MLAVGTRGGNSDPSRPGNGLELDNSADSSEMSDTTLMSLVGWLALKDSSEPSGAGVSDTGDATVVAPVGVLAADAPYEENSLGSDDAVAADAAILISRAIVAVDLMSSGLVWFGVADFRPPISLPLVMPPPKFTSDLDTLTVKAGRTADLALLVPVTRSTDTLGRLNPSVADSYLVFNEEFLKPWSTLYSPERGRTVPDWVWSPNDCFVFKAIMTVESVKGAAEGGTCGPTELESLAGKEDKRRKVENPELWAVGGVIA